MKNPIPGILLCFTLFLLTSPAKAQDEDTYRGIVSGKIFSNFNIGLKGPDRSTAFELTRAYFGYERQLSDHFSANVKLDVGSPNDLSEFSRIRRYAYFKNAGIKYTNGNFTAWGGLFDMIQFKVQEKFWGYRYLYKSYLDEYRFGPSADLGAGARYRFSPKFEADLVVSNGEGYSSPQRDDHFKTGMGITYRPTEKITLRGYYAIFSTGNPQMTFTGFAGYNNGSFRIGADYNYQMNYKFNPEHDRYGYSVYSTYIFTDTREIFIRYDQLYSNIIGDNSIPWNLPNDGSALLTGIQFTPISNIHLSMDYQDWVQFAGNGEAERILYIHLEAIF